MASTTFARTLTAVIFVVCVVFNGYATFGVSAQNGLLDALDSTCGHQVAEKSFLGGPTPYKTTYTGIRIIDNHLVALAGFFVLIIGGPATWDVTVSYWCLMAEICAAWMFIRLEGYRGGKSQQGRITSWTGFVGILMQNLTVAVTAPIYFLTHILTSPASSSNPTPEDLAIDPSDSTLLPHLAVLSYVIPTFIMSLPSPSVISPGAHYTWLIMWLVFPMTETVYYYIAKLFLPNRTSRVSDDTARTLVARNHRIILYVCLVPRTIAMAIALTPADLAPAALRPLFEQLTLASLFVPYWPWDSPLAGDPASPVGKTEVAKLFLQWDTGCAGVTILVWAAFVYLAALPDRQLLRDVLPKVLTYGVVGGPVAAATVLIMERDAAVAARSGRGKMD